jgi:hypothetical protein
MKEAEWIGINLTNAKQVVTGPVCGELGDRPSRLQLKIPLKFAG